MLVSVGSWSGGFGLGLSLDHENNIWARSQGPNFSSRLGSGNQDFGLEAKILVLFSLLVSKVCSRFQEFGLGFSLAFDIV